MKLTESQIKMLKIGVPIFLGLVVIAIVGIVIFKKKAAEKRSLGDTSKIRETFFNNPVKPVIDYTPAEWDDINKYPRELAAVLFYISDTVEWMDMVNKRDYVKMRRIIKDEVFDIILSSNAYDKFFPPQPFSEAHWKYFETWPKGPVFTCYVSTNIWNAVIKNRDSTKMSRIWAISTVKQKISDMIKAQAARRFGPSVGKEWG